MIKTFTIFTSAILAGPHTLSVRAFPPFSTLAQKSLLQSKQPISAQNNLRHHQSYPLSLSSRFNTFIKMSSASEEIKKRVLVPIAEDSEEIETTAITDVLVRFGADVVVASVKPDGDLVCKMSRGIKIMADVTIEDATKEEWDIIALPGGLPGADHLRDCPSLIELLKKQQQKKKLYGAVCAAPAVVLASHGLIGAGATCYPAPPFRSVMSEASDDAVVVQDNVVTSQGPGTSLLFALSLGELLYGKEEADKIAAALLVDRK